jgi:putative DNA primase/helicase
MAGKKDNVVSLTDVRAAVNARAAEEQKKYGSDGGGPTLSSKFVLDCLNSNEFGDGLLFCALHRDKLVYNASGKEWLRWSGHHWELDVLDSARAGVEAVAQRYLSELVPLAKEIQDALSKEENAKAKELIAVQSAIRTRVSRLRSDRGRKNCLQFAMASVEHLSIPGELLDANPLLFPCANGVVDLTTGMLHDGRPEDYMVKASPVEFHGVDADRSLWVQTLLEIYDGSREMVDFLQRLAGFYLTGLSSLAVFPVFHGRGRNGKSLIFDVFMAVMGPLAAPIHSELFLDQGKNSARNPAAPSPEIMALKGLRLAVGSETDDGRKVSASRIKWLTGSDRLTGRNPNDKYQVSFAPTHKLGLLTNHKPGAPAHDFAFWERCLLIRHPLSFVDREPRAPNERRADPSRKGRLLAMLPGVLGWMVEGCLIFMREGLSPPDSVTEATSNYQRDEDFLGRFLENRCFLAPGEKVGATALHEAFKEWWLENEDKNEKSVPSMKRLGPVIAERFEKKKVGTYHYFGLRLKTEFELKEEERQSSAVDH